MTECPDLTAMEVALSKLHEAVRSGLPRSRCLRRWSEFIRLRDAYRCVDCHSVDHLSAHHICRKTFLPQAEYQTGNGITLCRECHGEAHRGFNGRPHLGMPVDAQGGEKLPLMERFYSVLLDDAMERDLFRDEFYFIGQDVLSFFKEVQGYPIDAEFPGRPLEQAYLILAEVENPLREAIAQANGFSFGSAPLLPGGVGLFSSGDAGPAGRAILRAYRQRSP